MSHKDMVLPETENKSQRKVFVPNKLLECLPRSPSLPTERLRWNTNEEIASFLISFERHDEWLCCSLKTRPKNGSIILYNRKKVKYRKDGYCWKKRKDGKTTREDHMKLKVQGMECLYGCYVHSSIVPTFHRRCYWLLQNPDIVLVHYLNVPSPEDAGKCSPLVCADRHNNTRWSRDELLGQLKPMFHSMKCTVGSGDFTIEDLVQHILDRQRTKPQPRTHACLCNHVSSGANHRCNSTKHRIISPKLDKTETKPAPIKPHSPVASPRPPTAPPNSSSPPPAHTASITVTGNHHHGNLTAVALPPLIVMTTTSSATPVGVNHSASPLAASNPAPATALSHNNNNNKQLVALLLTPPPAATPVQAAPPTPSQHQVTPSPPPPLTFDPDAFLNSPKQGQTYGRALLSNQSQALAPSPASSLSSLSSTDSAHAPAADSAPLTPAADSAPLTPADPAPLTWSVEIDDSGTKNGKSKNENEHSSAPPTKVALIQSHSEGPRRQSSAPLLLVCQDSQLTNQMQRHNENSVTFSPQPRTSPVQVKQEIGRRGSEGVLTDTPPHQHHPRPVSVETSQHQRPVSVETPRSVSMETDGAEEEGLEISFDSPFPDLISDLIDETPPPLAVAPPVFPTGVRYMVPPQPSPSSSFLPFPQPCPSPRRAAITDFSPEWSYPEGGVKVLITGPWSEPSGRYSCVFDQSTVPACLIQPGVLRCYCPAHEAGLVCLQVLESGGSVSSSVLFEYRARNANSLPSSQLDWLSLDDNQFRMSILERLEQMERRMAEMASRENGQQQNRYQQQQNRQQNRYQQQNQQQNRYQQQNQQQTLQNQGLQLLAPASVPEQSQQWFERRIVGLCERMMSGACWRSSTATAAAKPADAKTGGASRANAGGANKTSTCGTNAGGILANAVEANRASAGEANTCGPNANAGGANRANAGGANRANAGGANRANTSGAPTVPRDRLHRSTRHRGMTLLHLAAAQGYTHLIHTLIRWRSVNRDSLDLEQEVDPLNVDHFSCTPLMWACALGHQASAELLYSWSSEALGIPDSLGRLPLAVARSRGHTRLATALELLHTRKRGPQEPEAPERGPQNPLQEPQSPAHTNPPDPPKPDLRPDPDPPRSDPRPEPDPPRSEPRPDPDRPRSNSRPEPDRPRSEPESRDQALDSPQPLSPLSTSPDTGLSSLSSLPSPFDPASSPSLSSAYSSVGPAPMDTDSPSDSPASLWEAESNLMEYESSAPPTHVHASGTRRAHSSLQQLLGLNECHINECRLNDCHLNDCHLNEHLNEDGLNENNENEELLEDDEIQVDVAALAEQIIEATPERIKREDFPRGAESALRERRDNPDLQDTWLAAYLETVDPPRRLCPPSPLSALALHRLRPPSSAAWAEFLNASANGKMERDFALLTLTDGEQRELYEAARIIQTAFRRYKGRRLKEQQDMAAAVIQRCYRKYKQLTWIALKYALYKKMTQAAILIQSKFRSYYEQKRFQQSRRAAVLIQQYYRSYKEYERTQRGTSTRGSFLTKKQDQAARKIMRFLRRCRHRIKELKQSRELERRGLTT